MNRFAVIPTRNRPEHLNNVLADLQDQVDLIFVIDNGSTPPVHEARTALDPMQLVVIRDSQQPPNLSRLWNVGLDQARVLASEPYKVAVVNDDARIPDGWFAAVSEAMDRTGAAAGCSSPHPHITWEVLKTAPDTDLFGRMHGAAFILRGGLGLRADERLQWTWGDTDLDWQARKLGGMVSIPTRRVQNLLADQSTVGVLAEQSGRDRAMFATIHGSNPW